MSYGQVSPESTQVPTCYRHPDQISYVSCHRCGRPVCPRCQVSAPVGVQCIECVRNANRAIPSAKTEFGGTARSSAKPVVTYTLIGVNLLIYVLQWVIPNFTQQIVLVGALAYWEPWRVLTSAFAHSQGSLLHIAMNMYGVYICGVLLEPRLGRVRFGWLYFLSALGGSLGVLLLSDPYTATLGASGALSGLFLALFVVFRTNRTALRQMGIVLLLNVVMGFVVPGISWQGHLGGAVLGLAAAASIVLIPKGSQRTTLQFVLLGILSVVVTGMLYLAAVTVRFPLA